MSDEDVADAVLAYRRLREIGCAVWLGPCWPLKARVRKRSGASWQGRIVGFYSTTLTPRGYCVESEREPGSVQIYPEAALDLLPDE